MATMIDVEVEVHWNPTQKQKRKQYFLVNAVLFNLRDGDIVTLTHCAGFNRLFVMPFVQDGALIHLADDIELCQEKQEPMNRLPEPGEIILAKYRMNGLSLRYYRCVVRTVFPLEQKLLVRILDAGEQIVVNLSDCKYIDEAVANHPIYARSVILEGVEEMPEDLMLSRVTKYVTSIANQKMKVQVVKQGPRPSSTPIVNLYYGDIEKSTSRQKCANAEILQTGKMLWESSFKFGNVSDDAIFRDLQPHKPVVFVHEVPLQMIPLNDAIPVQIVAYNSPSFVVCVPQLPRLEHDLKVLNSYIKKYTETVSGEDYYPRINEVVLVKDLRDESASWLRGARYVSKMAGDNIYVFDYGYFIPIEYCQARKIPFEFTGIGSFAFYATLTVLRFNHLSEQQLKEGLNKVFYDGSIHLLEAIRIDPLSAVVEFICPKLEGKLMQALYGEEEESEIC